MTTYENMPYLLSEEAETARKSKEDFIEKLVLVESISELFLYTCNVMDNKVKSLSWSKDAAYRISFKIFRILRCSLKAALESYYDVSMALLRIAYENHLLMKYLSENEKDAELWFKGKRFSPKFLRENVSYSSHSIYQKLSEFIHCSFKSSMSFTVVEEGQAKAIIGEYDKEQCDTALLFILMTLETTMIWLSITLAQELMDNKKWHSEFKATVPKIWKYIGQIPRKCQFSQRFRLYIRGL
jgi:hypothetical protein